MLFSVAKGAMASAYSQGGCIGADGEQRRIRLCWSRAKEDVSTQWSEMTEDRRKTTYMLMLTTMLGDTDVGVLHDTTSEKSAESCWSCTSQNTSQHVVRDLVNL